MRQLIDNLSESSRHLCLATTVETEILLIVEFLQPVFPDALM